MNRRSFLALALTPIFREGDSSMCTEVKHGMTPQWESRVERGARYDLHVRGYYTDTHDLTAAGVSGCVYNSTRPAKQMAELLGMRTAFLDFFFKEYERLGGTREEALQQVEWICKTTREGKKCVVTETGWELR